MAVKKRRHLTMARRYPDQPIPQAQRTQQPERYWEGRWRDEKAHNEALKEALLMARARIEYLAVACTNPRHFEANGETFLPKIDAALNWVPVTNGDQQ